MATIQELLAEMKQRLNTSDLQTITFDMGLSYEDIFGDKTTFGSKALALIQFCQRRNMLSELQDTMQRYNPAMKQINIEDSKVEPETMDKVQVQSLLVQMLTPVAKGDTMMTDSLLANVLIYLVQSV